ncbi:signal peptidase I [Suttonella sp. R2A3]|uniref:signal peptidase I n=1 Tax=Suttonella sp. R2A3 TaxID=2908648 RepID=UPI00287FF5E9|nr:signal peptidase I [Suttonella sp. R2A3]
MQAFMEHFELILTLAVVVCFIFYIIDGMSYRKERKRLQRVFKNRAEDATDRHDYSERLNALNFSRLKKKHKALYEHIAHKLEQKQPLAGNELLWLKRPCYPQEKFIEFFSGLFWILFIVWFVRSFLYEPFQIPSASMEPNLQAGDFILTSKFAYGVRLPVIHTKIIEVGNVERGDVMVFRYPNDPAVNYIKRVIGLPGDKIRFADGIVSINDEKQTLTLVEEQGLFDWYREELDGRPHIMQLAHDERARNRSQGEFVVPEGQFFVMGDNRDNSRDGRMWNNNNPLSKTPWGFVPEDNIVGKALFIWMNSDCVLGEGECGRIGNSIE